jgi:hypothetical protein
MNINKGFHELLATSQTSSARTADPKPDLNAASEVNVECAFKATMDFDAEAQRTNQGERMALVVKGYMSNP